MRHYKQYCGLARALDIVGGRWTLLIVRNLLLGPLRFSDLVRTLPGLGPALLTTRLREMEADGLVRRTALPAPAGGDGYALTEEARELERAIHALGDWGFRRLPDDDDGEWARHPDWAMVALTRRYQGGVICRAEIRCGDHVYEAVADGTRMRVERGPALAPDLVLSGEASTLPAALLGLSDDCAAIELVSGEPRLRDALLGSVRSG